MDTHLNLFIFAITMAGLAATSGIRLYRSVKAQDWLLVWIGSAFFAFCIAACAWDVWQGLTGIR